MRIKNINISNFRQYMDVNLSFPKESTYNLNYILAENGIGKTTLLNAITWCLYGKELHITEALKDKTLPLLTLKCLREMDEGDEKDVLVSITLKDVEEEITFVRWITYRKTEEGEAYEKSRGQKVILSPRDGEPDIFTGEEEFRIEVNKRLPYKIQQFFFFDGEQLDTYLASTAGENVEQTVLQISQIDLLVTMKKNLSTVSDEMRRTAARTSTKSAEINRKYEIKKEELEEIKENYKERKSKLEKAKIELENINNELGDDPDISELELKRDTLDAKLNLLDDDQTKNINEIKNFLRRYMILLSALPRMKKMYDLIKEKEKNKQLPPKFDRADLEEMLIQRKCHVCDRELDADSTIFIANLIKRFELGQETGTLLTRMLAALEIQISDTKNYEKERDLLYKEKAKIEDEITETSTEIKRLDSIIDKYTNKEHIINLYHKRGEIEKYIKDEEKMVLRKEIELENTERDLDDLLKELTSALSKDEKNYKMRKQAELAEKAKEKVSDIIDNIKGDIRKQISNEMSSKFFQLMWKTKFRTVEITENYSASVINNDGFECLGSCSAAERELLVLAFTLALHKESGFDGPLVIDTPISRISGELRVAFAKVLRTVSQQKQIILFVTEDEYSTNIKDIFEPYANKKYKFELEQEDFVKVGEL